MKPYQSKYNNNEVIIDYAGRVICRRQALEDQCFLWRAPIACPECPMRELIKRSPNNKTALGAK